MRGSLKILTVRGVGLYIHWTIIFVIGYILAGNPTFSGNANSILWSLLFVVAVFACITLHEFAHVIVASAFGVNTRNIVLLPIGGVANIERIPEIPKEEIAISIAGPVASLAIAGLFRLFTPGSFVPPLVPGELDMYSPPGLMYSLMIVNLGLALFNLIPAFPMDGGRVFRAVLALWMPYLKTTKIAAFISKFIAALLLLLGIIAFNPFLALIGIFVFFSANMEVYFLEVQRLIKDIHLRDVLIYNHESLAADITAAEAARQIERTVTKIFIVMEDHKPLGTLSRKEIVRAIAEDRSGELLKNLGIQKIPHFEGSMVAGEVLDKLIGAPEKLAAVFENGIYSGLVSLTHIIEHGQMMKASSLAKSPEVQ